MSNQAARLPAEWSLQARCWLAYPADPALWGDELVPAQQEFITFCRALGTAQPLTILVPSAEVAAEVQARLGASVPAWVSTRVEAYGDIWLRDTGPLFLAQGDHRGPAACFAFNGWGERYLIAADQGLNARLAQAASWQPQQHPWVLEGGAVEVDGAGLLLTTRQCLLRGKRNPGMTEADASQRLCAALGAQKVIWLDDGLQNDHTDGHIDTLARFVAPAHVVCMRPQGADDPNAAVLRAIRQTLAAALDLAGQPLQVSQVGSPGRVDDAHGEPMPASYLNYVIGNGCVLVPTYGVPHDAAAVAQIAALFPHAKVQGLPARAILSGGGAFHCMSQQEPALAAAAR